MARNLTDSVDGSLAG
jgi:putative transposase